MKHVSLCLLVYEWACGLRPMNRSKDADEVGICASSDVRKACVLMVFNRQKAIEQIIYLVRGRIWEATSSQKFRVMVITLRGWFLVSATSSLAALLMCMRQKAGVPSV